MRLTVATNFDDGLIEKLKGFPVHDLFGKLASDAVGGGRSSYMLSPVSKQRLRKHIQAIHAAGFKFNYLLNAACLDNREYTARGQRDIRRLLDDVCAMNVDSVTVAVPYLLRLIKRAYPKLPVRISVFAQIDTVSKAVWWADTGADVLTLDSQGVNREFETLRAIRRAVSIDLQLMVNNHCLARCPMAGYHMDVLAHSSQKAHASGGFVIDHCFLTCTSQKLRTAVDYIRGDWIRPEDLKQYEALGYDWFKVVERNAPTQVLLNRVKAYTDRRYDGNLLDLIQPFGYDDDKDPSQRSHQGLFWSWKMLLGVSTFKPSFIRRTRNLAKRRGWLGALSEKPISIHNRSLDGFINRFLERGCRDIDCAKCRYCHTWAEKAVHLEPEFRKTCLSEAEHLLKEVECGTCWR